MRIAGYNWESLKRHGVTEDMISEVLAGAMVSFFPKTIQVTPAKCWLGSRLPNGFWRLGCDI
jgi:hypothetical protein